LYQLGSVDAALAPADCKVDGILCNQVVRQRLENGADKIGAQGQDLQQWTRHGRLNIAGALAASGSPSGDLPPTASFSYTCMGLDCTFKGNASSDDNGINNYHWDFDENEATYSGLTASTAVHTYSAAGTYSVTLTVKDNASQTHQVTVLIQVKTNGRTKGDSGGDDGGSNPGNCPPAKAAQGKC
jgi:PKD repeat protein